MDEDAVDALASDVANRLTAFTGAAAESVNLLDLVKRVLDAGEGEVAAFAGRFLDRLGVALDYAEVLDEISAAGEAVRGHGERPGRVAAELYGLFAELCLYVVETKLAYDPALTASVATAREVFGGGWKQEAMAAVEALVESGAPLDGFTFGVSAAGGSVAGGSGRDLLIGADGGDVLSGAGGRDLLVGGGGDDWIESGGSGSFIDGGGGDDLVVLDLSDEARGIVFSTEAAAGAAGLALVDGSLVRNVERASVTSGAGADLIVVASGTAHVFATQAGDDELHFAAFAVPGFNSHTSWNAGAGSDRLVADLSGSEASVRVEVGSELYVHVGGSLALSAIDVERLAVIGGAAGDVLIGHVGDDALGGGGGDDELRGGAGDDRLEGGEGDDLLAGGVGSDWIDGGGGVDRAVLDLSGEVRGVAFATAVAAGEAGLTLRDGTHVRNVERVSLTTGAGADSIVVASGAEHGIATGSGDDRLRFSGSAVPAFNTHSHWNGGAGSDHLVADLSVSSAAVSVDFGSEVYVHIGGVAALVAVDVERVTALGGAGDDVLVGHDEGDVLSGGAGNDDLRGRGGDDRLNGGAGDDALHGGAGNDRFVVDAVGDVVVEADGEGFDTVEASVSFSLAGQHAETLVLTGTGAIDGSGNELANVLTGNNQANRLDGGAGADAMAGRKGDDVYIVDDAGDRVMELAGEGGDTVFSAVTWSLAGQYVEVLNLVGEGAIGGSGNGLDNRIVGNMAANLLSGGAGNDRLDGGAGADMMAGGTGNDVFVVDHAGDRISEKDGEGVDAVEASISYSLAGQYVEALTLTGAANLNGAGNNQANRLTGNAGANLLNGLGGADLMAGGAGDDRYVVDDAGDKVVELAGEGMDGVEASVSFSLAGQYVEALTLTGSGAIDGTGNGLANTLAGNGADNVLSGGGGNDVLNGRGGGDWLYGGAGKDVFVFDTALGAGNVDRLLDFAAADDMVRLDRSVFAGLAEGALSAAAFVAGISAKDGSDRIVHDKASGNLWYDADGSGGLAAILFANAGAGEVLTAADFVVVA